MKVPDIRVTVNYGDYEGISGKVTGYDRDKYYQVSLDNGIDYSFKGYYLNGISELKGHGRYLLQYNNHDVKLNHKELTRDKNIFTGKGKGYNKRFRFFDIYITDDKGECVTFDDLNFGELKSKVRYSMMHGFSFEVYISTYSKNSSSFSELLSYHKETDSVYSVNRSKKGKVYYGTFERGLMKVINCF